MHAPPSEFPWSHTGTACTRSLQNPHASTQAAHRQLTRLWWRRQRVRWRWRPGQPPPSSASQPLHRMGVVRARTALPAAPPARLKPADALVPVVLYPGIVGTLIWLGAATAATNILGAADTGASAAPIGALETQVARQSLMGRQMPIHAERLAEPHHVRAPAGSKGEDGRQHDAGRAQSRHRLASAGGGGIRGCRSRPADRAVPLIRRSPSYPHSESEQVIPSREKVPLGPFTPRIFIPTSTTSYLPPRPIGSAHRYNATVA